MKIKPSRAIDILKLLGIQDAQLVAEEEDEEYDEKTFFDTVDANRRVVLEPQISDKLLNDLKGKTGGTLRTLLVRTTGISRKVLDEIPTDEEAIKTALQFREEKYSTDSKTMREQLDGITAGHQTELETLKAQYEAKVAEANQKYISRDIDDFIVSKLEKKALPEGADRKEVAKILRNLLSPDIDLGFDETERKPLTFQKGTQNPALNLAKNNSFDWDEAIDAKLNPLGLLRKDMRDQKPEDAMRDRGGDYKNGNQNQLPKGPVSDYNTQRQAQMDKLAGAAQ